MLSGGIERDQCHEMSYIDRFSELLHEFQLSKTYLRQFWKLKYTRTLVEIYESIQEYTDLCSFKYLTTHFNDLNTQETAAVESPNLSWYEWKVSKW